MAKQNSRFVHARRLLLICQDSRVGRPCCLIGPEHVNDVSKCSGGVEEQRSYSPTPRGRRTSFKALHSPDSGPYG